MGLAQTLTNNPWIMALVILWVLPWKAVSLWKAVKNNSKPWFVVLLVLNTLGILEILYIFIFGKKKSASISSASVNE